MPQFRVAPELFVTARIQMDKDAVCFDGPETRCWVKAVMKSCHESVDTVNAFTSWNPVTHA